MRCNSHVNLGADTPTDIVLKQVQQSIGAQQVSDVRASEKKISPTPNRLTLALINITRLLSLGYAAHSTSCYSEYKEWTQAQYG